MSERSLFFVICFLTAMLAVSRTISGDAPKAKGELGHGAFRIVEAKATGGGSTTYLVKAGDSCTFELLLGTSKLTVNSPVTMAVAELIRRSGADCSSYLQELAPELGYKGNLPSPPRETRLKVAAGILGTNQSRFSSGSFAAQPAGHWLVTKLFLADAQGEVYLNLNSVDGIGEFSLKDEDYADVVVRELAKVFLPMSSREHK